jgi:hypothetical protein
VFSTLLRFTTFSLLFSILLWSVAILSLLLVPFADSFSISLALSVLLFEISVATCLLSFAGTSFKLAMFFMIFSLSYLTSYQMFEM